MPLARDDLFRFFLVLLERPGRVNPQMCQRRPQPHFPPSPASVCSSSVIQRYWIPEEIAGSRTASHGPLAI